MAFEFTGERVIPGQVDTDLWNEHLARYAFAARVAAGFARGRSSGFRVLDAGCGSGYGTALLARALPSAEIVGIDVSAGALEYARSHYAAGNLHFEQGDCCALAPDAGPFDLIVAFEVIEHLPDASAFLGAAARVLGASGMLIVSTPNRRYYTDEREYTNPFHTREYDTPEFDALLSPFFSERAMFAQNHAPAVSFFPCAAPQTGRNAAKPVHAPEPAPAPPANAAAAEYACAPAAGDQPHFLLAICSAGSLPAIDPFVFVPSGGNILRERELHIEKVESWIDERERIFRREHDETVAWAHSLEKDVQEAREVLDRRDAELAERNAWAKQLDEEIQRLAAVIKELQSDVQAKTEWARSLEHDLDSARTAFARLQEEFDERTAWALRLDAELQTARVELAAARNELGLVFASRWYRLGRKLNLGPELPSDPARAAGPAPQPDKPPEEPRE